MICVKRKFYLEIHPIVALHNHVRRPTFLALVWSVMLKQKKLKKKLWSVSACIWDFRGATIKHLKHHVLPHLVDDTPDIAVLHGGYNDLGYKKKKLLVQMTQQMQYLRLVSYVSLMVLKIFLYLAYMQEE